MRLLADGGATVRLANGHPLDARPRPGNVARRPLHLGEKVTVELDYDEMQGWRLSRRA